jgi:hypothetical protein
MGQGQLLQLAKLLLVASTVPQAQIMNSQIANSETTRTETRPARVGVPFPSLEAPSS